MSIAIARPTAYSIVFVVALFSVVSHAIAADTLTAYEFYKQIDRTAVPTESIVTVTLDSDVLQATRDGFPDLRIVDDQEAETPYVTEQCTESRQETSRQSIHSRVASLQETDGNQIEVVIRLDDKAPSADGFTVVTPLKDFERRVRVFGSNDGKGWKLLVPDGLIFDYSRYMDVRNGEVALPSNAYRQFKVAIDDIVQERPSAYRTLTRRFRNGEEQERIESSRLNLHPFRIDRLGFWHKTLSTRKKSDTKTEYPITEFSVEEDAKSNSTVVHVKTRREPLTEMTLVTDSRNFSRLAVVEVPVVEGVQTRWVKIGGATISVIDLAGIHRDQLTITFPERRQEEYRITIANQDNPPIAVTAVKAKGNTYRAKFLATPDRQFRLFYGSETAERPHYDAAAVLASVQGKYEPIDVPLSAQTKNPAFDTSAGITWGRALENKYVLGGVIVLMVLVLAWVLFQATRKVNETPWENP